MNKNKLDEFYMHIALKEASVAADNGDVPCGAVIVLNDEIIGKAHNQTELLQDPTAHAEILAITQAVQKLGNWRLKGSIMYVTKEPCVMCAGAIVLARIKKVIWGMTDKNHGGAISQFNILNSNHLNHKVDYESGLLEEICKSKMQLFFSQIRSLKKNIKKK